MVNVHMFFLGSASFPQVDVLRGGFLDCLMDPLLAHLGWHSPLVNNSREIRVGHFWVDPSFLSLTRSG